MKHISFSACSQLPIDVTTTTFPVVRSHQTPTLAPPESVPSVHISLGSPSSFSVSITFNVSSDIKPLSSATHGNETDTRASLLGMSLEIVNGSTCLNIGCLLFRIKTPISTGDVKYVNSSGSKLLLFKFELLIKFRVYFRIILSCCFCSADILVKWSLIRYSIRTRTNQRR